MRPCERAAVGGILLAACLVVGGPGPALHAQATFDLAGEVSGLYPGADRILHVEVDNPHDVALEVTGLDVEVEQAGPGCSADVLEVGPPGTVARVAANATATVPVVVTMDPAAPDTCQGATWPLRFRATAVGSSDDDGSEPLPVTGSSVARLVVVAAALLALGVGLRRRTRRRLRQEEA